MKPTTLSKNLWQLPHECRGPCAVGFVDKLVGEFLYFINQLFFLQRRHKQQYLGGKSTK